MRNPKKKFAKIYDIYVGKIYRFVFLKVGSQETAEDLTGQVFAKGWDRMNRISKKKQKEIENVPAYLFQIARAEIANYYRGKAKFQVISTAAEQIVDPDPAIEEKQQLQSDLEVMRSSLNQLKDEHQNVLIWRYLDGFSNKDIAQIIEKPEGTVRVIIHRALKELREKMSD